MSIRVESKIVARVANNVQTPCGKAHVLQTKIKQ